MLKGQFTQITKENKNPLFDLCGIAIQVCHQSRLKMKRQDSTWLAVLNSSVLIGLNLWMMNSFIINWLWSSLLDGPSAQVIQQFFHRLLFGVNALVFHRWSPVILDFPLSCTMSF